jgi:methylated-DNA-[protein]-cysteine S-methyltransferase
MKNTFYYDTEIGNVGIAENGKGITDLWINKGATMSATAIKETSLIKEASEQLKQYLSGNRMLFDLPLDQQGTEFQKLVWDTLKTIPYGQTWSYKHVAEKIGNAKACRAVGMANNRNTILIIVPCHRVIGAKGALVGYGAGIDLKEKLLRLEKINHKSNNL